MVVGMIASTMDDLHHNRLSGGSRDDRRERLEYLADLLGQLQQMADQHGCRKLSRMLAISHAEAQRETLRRGS